MKSIFRWIDYHQLAAPGGKPRDAHSPTPTRYPSPRSRRPWISRLPPGPLHCATAYARQRHLFPPARAFTLAGWCAPSAMPMATYQQRGKKSACNSTVAWASPQTLIAGRTHSGPAPHMNPPLSRTPTRRHPPAPPPVIYFVLRVYTMLSCMLTCILNSYLSCALRMAQD